MEFLQKTAEEMGIVPKALLTAPTLEPHLAYYYDQYQELARSRAYTEGQPLPIPVSELLAHCQLHQLSVTDSEELREMSSCSTEYGLTCSMPSGRQQRKLLPELKWRGL